MSLGRLLAFASLGLLLPGFSLGHDSRPLYVEVEQVDAQSYVLGWKVPPTIATVDVPSLTLEPDCPLVGRAEDAPLLRSNQRLFRCAPTVGPQRIEVRYAGANPSLATLVRVQRLKQEPVVLYAPPNQRVLMLAGDQGKLATLWQYLRLGVQHIAGGYDHLLFVACLLLLARTPSRVLLAISGFTLAHSVTLAMSALDRWQVPVPPTEAVIALSIVFLAVELVRQQQTLAWRYPGLVATLFGLLHGFGFASVLAQIGLPQGEVAIALLGFNLGVELGQLVFVALLLLLGAAWRAWLQAPLGWDKGRATQVAAYPIGLLACFWFWERVFSFA